MSATLSPALRLAAIALVAGGTLALVEVLTRERIAAEQRRLEAAALAEVLPADLHDNTPHLDVVELCAEAWLGPGPRRLYRARRGGQPSALVLEIVAQDGYSGPIALLVAIDREGRVLGVRVTAHRETPGLGDGIESRRSDWIGQFAGRSLGAPPPERWRVRREGGDFDALVGATVTSRAVIGAVERALRLVDEHGEALYGEPPPALACPQP